MLHKCLLPAILVALLVPQSLAIDLVGVVSSVTDGDTITVMDWQTIRHRVRLAAIDAPEKSQPYGPEAKDALAGKVLGSEVRIDVSGTDRYGRAIGRVWLGPRDVNAEMVADGHAWQYVTYDCTLDLSQAEREAREARLGLWAFANPSPPWEFRRQRAGHENIRR